MAIKHAFVIAVIFLVISSSAMAQDAGIACPALNANERFDATKIIVAGEPNYTMVIYSYSNKTRHEIMKVKKVISYKIVADGRMLFYTTNNITSYKSLWVYNGNKGSLVNLGKYPEYEVSDDGKYLITIIPSRRGEAADKAIIYNIEKNLEEVKEFDFAIMVMKILKDKIANDRFELDFYYNAELNGFEILFDQYGEGQSGSFTGIISTKDWSFMLTDRKTQLMKIMGYTN